MESKLEAVKRDSKNPPVEVPDRLTAVVEDLSTHSHGGATSWSVNLPSKIVGMHLEEVPPESSTTIHRHSEAMIYILSGKGHGEIQGRTFPLREGTFVLVPMGAWHRFWNDDTKPLKYIASYANPLLKYMHSHEVFDAGYKTYKDLQNDGTA